MARLALVALLCLALVSQSVAQTTCSGSTSSPFWKMNTGVTPNVCELCLCEFGSTSTTCLPVTDPQIRYNSYEWETSCVQECQATPANWVLAGNCTGTLSLGGSLFSGIGGGSLSNDMCPYQCKCTTAGATSTGITDGNTCVTADGDFTCATAPNGALYWKATTPGKMSAREDCTGLGLNCGVANALKCYQNNTGISTTTSAACGCGNTKYPAMCVTTQDGRVSTVSSGGQTTVSVQTVQSQGCLTSLICKAYGSTTAGTCVSADVKSNNYDWSCTTNALVSTPIAYTMKFQCDSGTNSNIGFASSCPVSGGLSTAFSNFQQCTSDKSLIEFLGPIMCGTVPPPTNLDMSCSSEFGGGLIVRTVGCFCKAFTGIHNSITDATVKADFKTALDLLFAELSTTISNSVGCNLALTCNVGDGSAAGTVKTYDVTFKVSLSGLTAAQFPVAKRSTLAALIAVDLGLTTGQVKVEGVADVAGKLQVTVKVTFNTQALADAFSTKMKNTPPTIGGAQYALAAGAPTATVSGNVASADVGTTQQQSTNQNSNNNPVTALQSAGVSVRAGVALVMVAFGLLNIQ